MKGYTMVARGDKEYLFLHLADWRTETLKIYTSSDRFQLWCPNEHINWAYYRKENEYKFIGTRSTDYERLDVRELNNVYFIVDQTCPEIISVLPRKNGYLFTTKNGLEETNPKWVYATSSEDADDAWMNFN
jgi:hypothetical protein